MKQIKLVARKRLALTVILGVAILVFTLAIRLLHLTSIPVFADEAIYIRWAQVMKAEATLRFLPLSDGKQPLFMWVVIPFLKVFSNPLISGRIVSVLSGVGTTLGIGVLSYLLFKSKKAAITASFLYSVSPFTFFFDRLALADSMLMMFTVWFLVFLVFSVKNLRFDFAMLAGFMLGGAFLTKSPALFSLILIPATILVANINSKGKARAIHLAKIGGLWVTAAVIGYGISQTLRLGPNFQMIAIRNLDYVFPVGHILSGAKDPFIFNLDRSFEWVFFLGPIWLFVLALAGVIGNIKKNPGAIMLLIAFYAFPLLVNSEFAKVFTARYILYTLPPLFILSGLTVLSTKIWLKISALVILIFAVHSLFIDYTFMTAPAKAPLPQSERSGYLEEWSAGWGLAESAKIIREEHAKNPDEQIVVGTEGYFGTLPDGLQMYLEKVPNVIVLGTGLGFDDVPDSLKASKKAGNKTYFVANSSRLNKGFKWSSVTILYSYKKPLRKEGTHDYVASGPQETFYLFQVN